MPNQLTPLFDASNPQANLYRRERENTARRGPPHSLYYQVRLTTQLEHELTVSQPQESCRPEVRRMKIPHPSSLQKRYVPQSPITQETTRGRWAGEKDKVNSGNLDPKWHQCILLSRPKSKEMIVLHPGLPNSTSPNISLVTDTKTAARGTCGQTIHSPNQ